MQDKPSNNIETKDYWIAVDWGTSSLRCWAMRANSIQHFAESNDGMSQLSADQFEPALLNLISDWLPAKTNTPIIACGMVGAKQGWVEAPYSKTPCNLGSAIQTIPAPVKDSRFSFSIVPGISQDAPADVMRGEETLIAGLLADDAQFSGAVCLPGTHCKWVDLMADSIQQFNTVITGELFGLLSTQSVLRFNTIAQVDSNTQAQFDTEFIAAVKEHAQTPHNLTTHLFSIRADGLLNNTINLASRARLSGLLIAADVFSMQRYWQGKQCVVIAKPSLSRLYDLAMTTLSDSPNTQISVRAMQDLTLKGLSRIAQQAGVFDAS